MTDKNQKFIDSLDKKTRERLKKKIALLIKNPFQKNQDIKKLQNWGENAHRLRMGKIRIIFQITAGKIKILAIDYRGNIY